MRMSIRDLALADCGGGVNLDFIALCLASLSSSPTTFVIYISRRPLDFHSALLEYSQCFPSAVYRTSLSILFKELHKFFAGSSDQGSSSILNLRQCTPENRIFRPSLVAGTMPCHYGNDL